MTGSEGLAMADKIVLGPAKELSIELGGQTNLMIILPESRPVSQVQLKLTIGGFSSIFNKVRR